MPASQPMIAPPEATPARQAAPPLQTVVWRRPESQPVQSAPTVTIDVTELWIKQLGTGSGEAQVRALRELAKFKQNAGHYVPQIAELLVKGDVTVRREVPLVLLQIGAPAKAATALLERAMNDEDTEVKVNAARCLVELGGK
jgi:HEAT repeat protein